jgi:LPS-assembly lipoprotein
MYKKTLFLLPVLLLAACGFHLRGHEATSTASISSVYLQSSGAPAITAAVSEQLQQANTRIADAANEAEYVIQLANENVRRSVLNVSAKTGKVEKYKLSLSVLMSVSKGGQSLIDGETIQVTRDYTFDDSAVLGKTSEEQVLREEMMRSASSQIIRRLNTLARK